MLDSFGHVFGLFGSEIDQLSDLELLGDIQRVESLSKVSNHVSFTFLWIVVHSVDVFHWKMRSKHSKMVSQILNVQHPRELSLIHI